MMRKWVQAVMMEPSLCKPDIQRQHIFIIVVCLFILQMSSKIVQHLTFLAGWTVRVATVAEFATLTKFGSRQHF